MSSDDSRPGSGGVPCNEASPFTAEDTAQITRGAIALGPLLLDLIALDEAGAISGIRAVAAERLRQVREGYELKERWTVGAMALIAGRDDVMPARSRYANAAALLAAAIDREARS